MGGELHGLPPIADARARVLVLGSMPGPRSLELGRYYAGPGNRFWRLVGDLVGVDPDLPYEERIRDLLEGGVALWDVFASCRREGALDSAIVRGTEVLNDVAGFVADHPGIRTIALNGKAAATAFHRAVPPALPGGHPARVLPLPSTSGANARWSYARLLAAWSAAIRIQPLVDSRRDSR